MKNLLYLFVFLLLTYTGCSKDLNPINNENDGSLVISGKINNFSGNFNKVYTNSYPYSDSINTINSEISTDGSFYLRIQLPSENKLSTYTPFNNILVINGDSSIFIDSINIVDSQLKYIRYDLYAQSSSRITYALPINLAKLSIHGEFAKVGDYFISYYYFNSQTRIQGYYKWRVVTSDSSREIITEFNINTKIGWNKVITKFKSEKANKAIYEVTDIDVEQGDWIIGASDSFSNAVWRL